jgi:hypothetical protein
MAKNKTTETTESVADYINNLKHISKREDSFHLIELIQKITKLEPKMWGPSIIGFGSYHYKYESGHEGYSPLVGFSPRASALTLYLSGAFERSVALLEKLGKHKTSKGCLYIAKLEDVDLKVLEEIIKEHIKFVKVNYEL